MAATSPIPATAYAQIGQIASQRSVHAALRWLHLHEQQIMRWQAECVAIPAPPFAENERADWFRARFQELGLTLLPSDSVGNVVAQLGELGSHPAQPREQPGMHAETADEAIPVILLSAHLDTVFAAGTRVDPVLEQHRLQAPGACDNGAGLAALLAIAASLRHAAIVPACRILFVANVGEEGEGDLRGMRAIYAEAPWRGAIAAHLVLDGAGHSVAVTGALGSRRFEAEILGAGGHSWTDAGRPNPILALADAITRLRSRRDPLSAPRNEAGPARTTWNIGTIEGGSSVNALPCSATARFDTRSTDPANLVHLEVELHRAVEDAVMTANTGTPGQPVAGEHALRFQIRSIGNRPAGALPADARILALLRAVDRHLGLRTELRTASTDANIPLSLGVEALGIGAGGEGGGIHTTAEWFDAQGRDLGLRRILLLLLALSECHSIS
jgi:tripeptide aminopeptidase